MVPSTSAVFKDSLCGTVLTIIYSLETIMLAINLSFKVPADKAGEVEGALRAHAEHMKNTYLPENADGSNPVEAYFTKAVELNNPTNPDDGTTGCIIFTVNEKWLEAEHIQKHMAKTMAAPHWDRIAAAMQYANVSVMGEIFYDMA